LAELFLEWLDTVKDLIEALVENNTHVETTEYPIETPAPRLRR
jgi:hypothetical protein